MNSGTTATIGADQTIQGAGQIGSSGATIINNGIIDANIAEKSIELFGSFTGGAGMYRASAGELNLRSSILTDITLDTSGTGSIGAFTGNPILTNVTNLGTLTIPVTRFISLNGPLTNNGIIDINPTGSNGTTQLFFAVDSTIDGTGIINLGGTFSPSAAQISMNSGTTATIGADQTIQGAGQIGSSGATIALEGSIHPSGPSSFGQLDMVGITNLSSSTELAVDIGGLLDGEFDRLTVSSSNPITLDGTLTVTLEDGYTPAFGDRWSLIDGGTQTGFFHTVNIVDAPVGQEFRVIYSPSETFLILTCDGDLTGDAGIDFFDVSLFLSYFSNQDVRGDLNNDGEFNFFDVSLFLQIFSQGCGS